jgi:flagellar biosynthesis/type III secretory pathway protein FliH
MSITVSLEAHIQIAFDKFFEELKFQGLDVSSPVHEMLTDLEVDIQEILTQTDPTRISEFEDCFEAGRQEGYEHGHDEGYDSGLEIGEHEGYLQGHEEGTADGYDEGFEEGQDEGYKSGYEEGFDDGYEQCQDDNGIEG